MLDGGDPGLVHADIARNDPVLVDLVGRAQQVADAQDRDFPEFGVEPALEQDRIAEPHEMRQRRPRMGQHVEDVHQRIEALDESAQFVRQGLDVGVGRARHRGQPPKGVSVVRAGVYSLPTAARPAASPAILPKTAPAISPVPPG